MKIYIYLSIYLYLYLSFIFIFMHVFLSGFLSLSLTFENETADKTLQDNNDKQDMYLPLEL